MKVYEMNEFRDAIYKKMQENRRYCTRETVYWHTKMLLETMMDILKEGDRLKLTGYFSMEPQFRDEQTFKKLNNGCQQKGKRKNVYVPAHYVPRLIPSKNMREICRDLDLQMMQEKG